MSGRKKQVLDLTEDEQKRIAEMFIKLDPKYARRFLENVSAMERAFKGLPIDPRDAIQRLTNVKDITERSRFQTYMLIAKQNYCRLATEVTGLKAFKRLADLEAAALISYKGESRKEYTEQLKAASSQADQQTITFGSNIQKETKKRFGFLRRKPKEESEFVNQ